MSKPGRYRLLLASAVLLLNLLFCLMPFSPSSAESWRDRTFVLGAISEEPQKRHAAMQRLAGQILPYLKDVGYESSDVLFARNIDEMVRHMRDGNLDALSETSFSAVRLIDEGAAEPLLREWKDGEASYRSMFVAVKGSAIHMLADLKGNRLAFAGRDLAMAFRTPLAILRMAGLEAIALDNIDQLPPPDKVGYVLAENNATQLQWVTQGTAAAAALSNLDWDTLLGDKAVAGSLELFHQGPQVMRSVFLVRSGLSAAAKTGIADAMLGLASTEAGRDILDDYNGARKYDRPTRKAWMGSLTSARRLLALTPGVTN